MAEENNAQQYDETDYHPFKFKKKDQPKSGDRPIGRRFNQIQDDLRHYIGNRNPEEEKKLKLERSPIIADANHEGVNILNSLRFHIRQAQTGNRFDVAFDQVNDIDAEALERHARDTIVGWRPDFEGLIPEYKRLAVLNMQKALEEARHGRNTQLWRDLNEEIEVLGWGIPPTDLVGLAQEFLESQKTPVPQRDLAAEELARQRKEKLGHRERIQRRVAELKEQGNPPEEWARLVFQEVLAAEDNSKINRKKSDEDDEIWRAIADALVEMPDNAGGVDNTSALARHMRNEHPNGLLLKDRLSLYLDARKRFMNRWVEVDLAGGSLTAMGLGKDDVPFKGISYTLERLPPKDWHVMFHMDEMFDDIRMNLTNNEIKEFLPNVGEGAEAWLQAGIQYTTLPESLLTDREKRVINYLFNPIIMGAINEYYKADDEEKGIDRLRPRKLDRKYYWPEPKDIIKTLRGRRPDDEIARLLSVYTKIPVYKNTVNNKDLRNELEFRMKRLPNINAQAVELAGRVYNTTLTHDLFDKMRADNQGVSEPRDIMWFEHKRVYDYGNKERGVQIPWTIGRLFSATPDQHLAADDDDAVGKARRQMLLVNGSRAWLAESIKYYQGELVGDFFQHFVEVPDELNPGETILRKMSSFIVNRDGTLKPGGFKNIPFLSMGEAEYAGYFGYTLNIAKAQKEALSTTQWKDPKEMTTLLYWEGKKTLLERVGHVSPRFNTKKFEDRGSIIRGLLTEDGGFNQIEVDRINGFSKWSDLDVITDSAQHQRAIDIVANNAASISSRAKEKSDVFWEKQFMKLKLIHALGEVYPGTLHPLKELGKLSTASPIAPELLEDIINALAASGYLNQEALDIFAYEVKQEMGIGEKWQPRKNERFISPRHAF